MIMFQRLNQFLVLVTLLSAGIGGLAVPLRRQDGAVALVAQSDQLCIDISNGAPTFKGCDGGEGQSFLVQVPPGSDRSTNYIVASSSGQCVTADSSSNVKLQDCSWQNADSNQEWNVDVGSTAIQNVGTGNCLARESDGSVATTGCAAGDSNQSIATELLTLFQN